MNSSNLHVYFLTYNISGFKKYLEGGEIPGDGGGSNASQKNKEGRSSSGPKSWTMSNMSSIPRKPDPNEKDAQGRTVLHLVCSTPNEPRAIEFLQVLLALPTIQVNIQDTESGWTALHRAMWSGNLRAARDLLSRTDTDLSIKDYEGLTAMDLYNSTCEGTNPVEGAQGTDLFTWGANKNCTLGLGDPADRTFAEHVNLLTQAQAAAKTDKSIKKPKMASTTSTSGASDPGTESSQPSKWVLRNERSKFDQVGVNQIVLGKFHTGVVTSENSGNLSLCGFGANGRLGRLVHTQYALLPQPDLPYSITSIALAQDHTLALTSSGHIMSFGQNRFAQLGYVIETPEKESAHKAFSSGHDEPIQSVPKRIVGPLKKEVVLGVAASRMSSACWTRDSVWTWGTNSGQLGYDKVANPVQILPRKVTGISQPVIGLAITDFALACLLDTQEVLVYYSDVYTRINFPTQRFPNDFTVYRPPQFVSKPTIVKITSCGITFAALSSLGDVFSFSLQNPIDVDVNRDPKDKHVTIKPQMVWALRKRFTAVKDVALGSDGTVIICTHSGHVYVRQRANKQWSFKRIPYLQRVIKVAANESGSFAAIRSDAAPGSIEVSGTKLADDLLLGSPSMKRAAELIIYTGTNVKPAEPAFDEDDDEHDTEIQRDIRIAVQLGLACIHWSSSFEQPLMASDLLLETDGGIVPAHSFILATRVPAIHDLLSGQASTQVSELIKVAKTTSGPRLIFKGVSLLTALLFLQYIYSDQIAAIWDSRIQSALKQTLPHLKADVPRVKQELQMMAEVLKLEELSGALGSTGKVPIAPRMSKDLDDLFTNCQAGDRVAQDGCNTIIALEDRRVYTHSLILRSRCPFFAALFDEPEWTQQRGNEDGHGRIVIDLKHRKWRSMRLVMRYLYDGQEDDIFDYRHQDTLDEFLDFVFEVIEVANELLLDRLVLVCSCVIRRHVYIYNAAALATEATFHNAISLKRSIFSYIACNLETMLENGLLDQMDHRILSDLTAFVQDLQGIRLPISRSNILVEVVLERQQEWLKDQDIPVPRLRPTRSTWKMKSPRLSPVVVSTPKSKSSKGKARASVTESPDLPASRNNGDDGDIFNMDEDNLVLPSPVTPKMNDKVLGLGLSSSSNSGPAWKSKVVEAQKVDMRSIMAEETGRTARAGSLSSSPKPGVYTPPRNMPATMASPSTSIPRSTQTTAPTWRTTTSSSPTQFAGSSSASSSFPSLSSVRAALPQSNRPSMLSQSRTVSNGQASESKPEVIVPTRNVAPRARTSEPAWSTATIVPPIIPTFSTSPNAQLSLRDIQQQEMQIQISSHNKPAIKSMNDIQKEEKELEKARVAQAEFDRWWQQEEARVAAEAENQRKKAVKQGKRGRGGRGGRGGNNQGSSSRPGVVDSQKPPVTKQAPPGLIWD